VGVTAQKFPRPHPPPPGGGQDCGPCRPHLGLRLMTFPLFSTSAQLQDFLLKEAGPGTLVVVPHQRLAHQVWQRQRAAALPGGRPAWEPVPLVILQAWMCDLFQSLWSEEALAPLLTRLALWRRALRVGPPLAGAAPDLEWAENLDEAYETLSRHLLPPGGAGAGDPPPPAWWPGGARSAPSMPSSSGREPGSPRESCRLISFGPWRAGQSPCRQESWWLAWRPRPPGKRFSLRRWPA
jgi:hypothetical protein